MMPFLFDVWSRPRQQVRRVAFQKILSIFSTFFLPVGICPCTCSFYFGLVTHNERFGHTSTASGLSQWKALHQFAPLTVRQITGLRLHILTQDIKFINAFYAQYNVFLKHWFVSDHYFLNVKVFINKILFCIYYSKKYCAAFNPKYQSII